MPKPLHSDRTPAETFLIFFQDVIKHDGLLAYWWQRVAALDEAAKARPRLVRALTVERTLGFEELAAQMAREDILSPSKRNSLASVVDAAVVDLDSDDAIPGLRTNGHEKVELLEHRELRPAQIQRRRQRHLPLSPNRRAHKVEDFVPSWERSGNRRHSWDGGPLHTDEVDSLAAETQRLLANHEVH